MGIVTTYIGILQLPTTYFTHHPLITTIGIHGPPFMFFGGKEVEIVMSLVCASLSIRDHQVTPEFLTYVPEDH